MSRILKGLKVLRNHWKKSTFAVALVSYGIHKALEKNEIHHMMKAFCEEAMSYGEKPIPAAMKPFHITVILNPAANNRKGLSLYQKFCAPLLHLAGVKVSLVQTELQGQARNLMEVMGNTDAVLIAGGNGTVHEVVTGLLRREDAPSLVSTLPLGILPVGKTNTVAKALFWEPGFSQARFLAEATMAAIRQTMGSLDVMKIQGESEKPVYAVSSLEIGAFRDTDSKLPKYWYLGPLKQKLGYFFSSLRSWPLEYRLDVACLPPCDGCATQPAPPPQPARRWWEFYSPKANNTSNSQASHVEAPHTDNCGEWSPVLSSDSDAVAHFRVAPPLTKGDGPSSLHAVIYPGDISRTEFITEGWQREPPAPPVEPAIPTRKLTARELKLVPRHPDLWLNIDSEAYEAQPMHLTHLPRWLRLYMPSNKCGSSL